MGSKAEGERRGYRRDYRVATGVAIWVLKWVPGNRWGWAGGSGREVSGESSHGLHVRWARSRMIPHARWVGNRERLATNGPLAR